MLDLFGQGITFTWNGEEKFTTTFGAFVTIFLFAVILAFGSFKAVDVFRKRNPLVSRTSFVRLDYENSQTSKYSPKEAGFDFSFGLTKPLDPSIGFFTVRNNERYYKDGVPQKVANNLNFTGCGTENFNFTNKQSILDYGINQYQCLEKGTTFELEGFTIYSPILQYLDIKLYRCMNSTKNQLLRQKQFQNVTCQSQSAIDQYLDNERMSFAFVNQLFQFENYEEPIRPFIDDSLFFEVDTRVRKNANLYIQQSHYKIQDQILLTSLTNNTFPQVSNIKVYEDNYSDEDGGQIVSIFIRFDKSYDIYSRKVNDILSLMAEIGGLHKALFAIGTLLVSFVAQKIFISNVIRHTYHVRKSYKDEAKGTKDDLINTVLRQNDIHTSTRKWYNRVKDYIQQKLFKKKSKIENQDINSLFSVLLHRDRFNYTGEMIQHYFCNCLCLRDIKKLKSNRYYKEHYKFSRAEDQLKKELDVVQIVKTLRRFKALSQSMLSQRHRLLLKFQMSNLVETSSASSDSDDNKLEELKLMQNSNPLVKLVMYGKIKKMILQFKDQNLTSLERNMMRGLFLRKLKDFQEETFKNGKKTLLERILDQNGNGFSEDLECCQVQDRSWSQQSKLNHSEKSIHQSFEVVSENQNLVNEREYGPVEEVSKLSNNQELLLYETAKFVHVYQAPNSGRTYKVQQNEFFEPGIDIENNQAYNSEKEHQEECLQSDDIVLSLQTQQQENFDTIDEQINIQQCLPPLRLLAKSQKQINEQKTQRDESDEEESQTIKISLKNQPQMKLSTSSRMKSSLQQV